MIYGAQHLSASLGMLGGVVAVFMGKLSTSVVGEWNRYIFVEDENLGIALKSRDWEED